MSPSYILVKLTDIRFFILMMVFLFPGISLIRFFYYWIKNNKKRAFKNFRIALILFIFFFTIYTLWPTTGQKMWIDAWEAEQKKQEIIKPKVDQRYVTSFKWENPKT